jgi:hypothetical protein
MRIGQTHNEYWNAQRKWHRWFAWHPVDIEGYGKVWLRFVQRQLIGFPNMEDPEYAYAVNDKPPRPSEEVPE